MTMFKLLTLPLLVFLLLSCSHSTQEPTAKLPARLDSDSATIILQDGPLILQYWERSDESGLWEEELGDIPALTAFRDTIESVLGDSLLQGILDRRIVQYTPWPEENVNHKMVQDGKVGRIQKINFLEAELLNYQVSRYPLFSDPTELSVSILRHDSLNRLRIYFAAQDKTWPPKAPEAIKLIEQALTEGWEYKIHLHNHFESDSNHYLGIMAPSLSDVQVLTWQREEYGLEEVRITNGFRTVVIPTSQLDSLNSH